MKLQWPNVKNITYSFGMIQYVKSLFSGGKSEMPNFVLQDYYGRAFKLTWLLGHSQKRIIMG
jgi:hypothetical protein